jgi:CBS domain-containing protein
MTLHAKDIMVTSFLTIDEEAPIEEAIRIILNGKIRDTGHKTISIMVVDEFQKLSGMITMFDVLYHLRPAFLNQGISGEELMWEGMLDKLIADLKGKKVIQVMSLHVISASPDEHLMVILDRMIKHKVRRLPVIENDKIVGVIYISDIYHKLFSKI